MIPDHEEQRQGSPSVREDSFGERLKHYRRRAGITARELAGKLGVSTSLISKIERGSAYPSFDVLRRLAFELHISVGDLIDEGPAQSVDSAVSLTPIRTTLIRAAERKVLRLPGSGREYQLLTPRLNADVELVLIEDEPGEHGSSQMFHEGGQESLLMLEGTLTVEVGSDSFEVAPGDCLTFDPRLPHAYRNASGCKAVFVLVAAPPNL